MVSDSSIARGGIGGGGGGFTLGPLVNTFSGADRAAAEAVRDAYAAAHVLWLALYVTNRLLYIALDDGAGATYAIQRQNVAGNGWEDVSGLVRGPAGQAGPGLAGILTWGSTATYDIATATLTINLVGENESRFSSADPSLIAMRMPPNVDNGTDRISIIVRGEIALAARLR